MKARVLVVDDDRLVADTLQLVFQANGFETEVRYSAAEALVRARTFDPELMLCDVTMPEKSGLELVEAMQRELPQCRVLMLTAYGSNEDRVENQSARMKRPLKLLRKPCRPEELLRAAAQMLKSA